MLKKLFSKRKGFTLVEIVIAFAIFVIMLAMIIQMLNLSTSRRRDNNSFAEELAADELALVTEGRVNSYDNDAGEDGNLQLEFDDGTELSWKYQLKDAEGNAGNPDGVNYIVGQLDYTVNGNDSTSSGGNASSGNSVGNTTGTQASRLDTRIMGTRGINYIQIDSVTKTDPGTGVSSRYTFEVTADGSSVAGSDKKYTQFVMMFFTKDGKAAHVSNIQQQNGYTCYSSGVNGVKLTVIHSSNSWNGPTEGMKASLSTKFTVDFTDAAGKAIDPEITAMSFGKNAIANGLAAKYTTYKYDVTDSNGNTTTYETPNIYGAYPKS